MTLRRIDGVDAAFLAAETPAWQFHVSALQILDPSAVPGFGFRTVRDLLAQRVPLVPQFRWRLRPAPLGVGWSWFVDDPDFHLDAHLHRARVRPPGGRREVADLVGDLMSRPIDRSRPLWEAWYLDGVEDGRVALLVKMHHSIVDGTSGVDVMSALFDLTPEPVEAGPAASPVPPAERLPSPWGIAARNVAHAAGVPRRAARLGRDMIGQGAAAVPLTTGRRPPALPFRAPRTPFNGQLTPRRAIAATALPLAVVKQVKEATATKVNDVVLAVCAGALRRYLQHGGSLPAAPLVAQVPVSTRTEASRGDIGTQVGSMFVSLATNIVDPHERLIAVHRSALAGKRLRTALAPHRHLGVSDVLPPGLFTLGARAWNRAHLDARVRPIYNVIVSSVPGPPCSFYVAGARIEAMYPLGPLLYGGGLNISAFSNGPTIDVGIVTCRDLVDDPWPIADLMAPALEELAAAVVPAMVAARQRRMGRTA